MQMIISFSSFSFMKYFCFLFLLLFFLVSCVDSVEFTPTDLASTQKTDYAISLSDINRVDFSHLISPSTKAGTMMSFQKEIVPVTEGADTLLFIVNYGDSDGWVLASSDKRMPPVLAIGEKSSFDLSLASENKGFLSWLNKVKGVTIFFKGNPDIVPDSTYLKMWQLNDHVITKGGGAEHEGEWLQLVYTMMDPHVLHYDVGHLLSTHWGQESPWNLCMPYDLAGTSRCPTGCAIVAAAQTAYYLHGLMNKPLKAYEYGVCNDYYNQNPDIDLYNRSSSNWAIMPLDSVAATIPGKNAVSALMAEVGKRANAIWNPNGTQASLSGIRDYFSYNNTSCSAGVFDNETVVSDLLNNKPVIVGLDACAQNPFGSHTAVIDGMRVFSIQYTYYSQWMPIGTYPPVEPEYPDLEHPELYVIGQGWGSNTLYYYRLNWGYDDSFLDDGLFLYGAEWGTGSYFRYEPDTILYNFH